MDPRAGATAWARLGLHLGDAQTATAIEAALAPENGIHCRTERKGAVLVVEVPEASLGRMAATVDDLLACASAALRAHDAVGDSTA
jgi:hypothetical protein